MEQAETGILLVAAEDSFVVVDIPAVEDILVEEDIPVVVVDMSPVDTAGEVGILVGSRVGSVEDRVVVEELKADLG